MRHVRGTINDSYYGVIHTHELYDDTGRLLMAQSSTQCGYGAQGKVVVSKPLLKNKLVSALQNIYSPQGEKQ